MANAIRAFVFRAFGQINAECAYAFSGYECLNGIPRATTAVVRYVSKTVYLKVFQ